MKKIKILRIIARLNIGGPAIHVILLTAGLDKTRFESKLISGSISSDEGDMAFYAQKKQIKSYIIPQLKRELSFFSDIIAFVKIYKTLKREEPDIVHTHTAKAGGLGRFAVMLYNLLTTPNKRIKLVHTFHGHIFSGYFSPWKSKAFILIERFLAHFTCKIITVSETIKRQLLSLGVGNEERIEVIPLGFELDSLLGIAPRKSDTTNIGIVGRLTPIKDHNLFLKSASLVIKCNPEFKLKFKVFGDGQLRGELEGYAEKLGISRYVDFIGWERNLVKIYSALDLVVLTSKNEGTPVSLIESMAAARPIVATDVGGVRDLLGAEINNFSNSGANFKILQRGIIVCDREANTFAVAVSNILKNTELKESITRGSRDFTRNRFNKQRLIKEIEELYRNILFAGNN